MKRVIKYLLCILILIPLLMWNWHTQKAMPDDLSMNGTLRATDDVEFVTDITYQQDGKQVEEHQLFDRTLQIIEEAEEILVVDLFLYNDDYNHQKATYDARAAKLTDALIEKRRTSPMMPIQVITDPINTTYGANDSIFFEKLKAANIDVLTTNLKGLRDSNPLYSSIWRSYLQWWPVSQHGFLPNAFNPDGGKMSVGAYLDLINFKANHRKIVLNEQEALVMSANVSHDGSSLHSNIGFVVHGDVLNDLYASENAVMQLSGKKLAPFTFDRTASGDIGVKVVSEGQIKASMLDVINRAKEGDKLQIGVFYLAERSVIRALKDAAARGVQIQMILDANRDAFGMKKNGIPNRPVAHELSKQDNLSIRWYETHGEQFHSKFLMLQQADQLTVIGGSANFTRRNIDDYNLETDLYMEMPLHTPAAKDLQAYFYRLWTNENGTYTAAYEKFAEHSLWKTALYRIQEFTGLSTF